jgi:hypothetical protein
MRVNLLLKWERGKDVILIQLEVAMTMTVNPVQTLIVIILIITEY